jgi:pimeloyl-ACP methyl ester carboxylesterase
MWVKSMKKAAMIVGGIIVAAAIVLGALKGLVWLGEKVPMIEPTGPERVTGALTLRPVRFAQTDFWFYPPRVDAEEGRLRVPARHSDPDGPSIDLRFIRFSSRASSQEATTPVVYLAGGPGGLGVYSASGDRFSLFMRLREVGDVIAFDQRGTASSEPYPICPGQLEEPFDRVLGVDELRDIYAPVLRDCFEHWKKSLHPDAFTTVESAADLEDLRIALGADQLHLVGISYGTHLALAYIRRYPDRVGRAVLAGVEGPDHTYKRPAIVDGIVRKIGDALEAEAGWKGFVDDIERAKARLRDEKPVVAVEDPTSGGTVNVALGPQDIKLAVLYGVGEREDFLKAAKRVRRIANGDDELLARYALRLRAAGAASVMRLSMDCASGATPERLVMIEAEKEGALIGDVGNLSLDVVCPNWPVGDLGSHFRSELRSDVPVLAISGTLDSRTPPSNAEEALSGFSDMHHLLIVGGGHDDDLLISKDAIGEAMVRFLQTGDPGTERVELPRL